MTAADVVALPEAPPCVPWCHTGHGDDASGWEWTRSTPGVTEASKTCSRIFGKAGMVDGTTVVLERSAYFDGAGGLEVDPPTLRIEWTGDHMNPAEALAFAALLREAVAFIT